MTRALVLLAILSSSCIDSCTAVGGGAMRQTALRDGAAMQGPSMSPPVDDGEAPPSEDNTVPGFSRFHARASGASRLAGSVTINGITVAPDFQYDGSDASATWTATTAGDTLTLGGTGTAPTTGVRGPFSDGTRAIAGGVGTGTDAQSYRGTTAVGDTNAEDVLVEVALRRCNPGANGHYVSTSTSGMLTEGINILAESGSTTFSIHDGTSEVFDRSDTDTPSTHGEWNLYHLYVDHGNATGAQLYRAGTIVSTSVSAATWGSIDGTTLTIGGALDTNTEGLDNDCGVAWVSQWSSAAWFAGGATNTTHWAAFSKKRTADLAGVRFADNALTEYTPTTLTRSGVTGCPAYDSTAGTTVMANVGPHWPCVTDNVAADIWGEATGTRTYSMTQWIGVTNLVADIQTTLASWTNVGSTDAEDALAGPFGDTTMGTITGDGIEGEHGLSTSETLTAARYTFSVFARAGTQGFAYLDVSSIANVSGYVDLSTCREGTVGSASTIETEDYGGGLCRISISYTGTAAGHTHRVLCAEADGDKSSAVATACLGVDYAQIELSDVVTPLHELTTARSALNIEYSDAGLYPGDTGTVEIAHVRPYKSATGSLSGQILTVSSGASANSLQVTAAATLFSTQTTIIASATQYAYTTIDASSASVPQEGTLRRTVHAWSPTRAWGSVGAWTYNTASSTGGLSSATATEIAIGSRETGTSQFRGAIAEMHFYDTARARGVGMWGDSITRATPYVDDGEQAYRIIGEAVEAGYRWVDARGVGSDDCDQVAARFACAGRGYEAVIIQCGINDVTNADTAAGIQGEIEGMIATAAACGNAIVIPSIMPFDSATAGEQSVIDDVNTWLATEASWTYVDASTEFDDGTGDWKVEYFDDGTHPNAAGQAWLADAYQTALGW